MSTGHKRISIDEGEAGMTLADNLLDASGNVLLPAGATLSDSTLNSLRRRGVTSISIAFELPALSEQELQARRARFTQRLAMLFRRCGTEGALGIVQQYVARYRVGEGS
jgi:hypothetical protein